MCRVYKIPGVPRRERASFFFVPGQEKKIFKEIELFLEQHADHDVILDLEWQVGWGASVRKTVQLK